MLCKTAGRLRNLVEPAGVPPGHPFKGQDLDLTDVIPRANVNEFVLVGSVGVFS